MKMTRFAILRSVVNNFRTAFVALLLAVPVVEAQEVSRAEPETSSVHFQTTAVFQEHGAFRSSYQGQNSLSSGREVRNTFTHTLFLGRKIWSGGEFYLNPEIAYGRGFSNVTGLAGFSNGEVSRVTGPDPTLYRARMFLRQTFGMNGTRMNGSGTAESESVSGGANRLSGAVESSRIVFTLGNFSALDVFDDNRYAHDARAQFLNWALMTNGAWDYPADARGYTWGASIEYIALAWALRYGRFLMPREANGLRLDYNHSQAHGDVLEFESKHRLMDREGALRLLLFSNRAHMGAYRQTIEERVPGVDIKQTAEYRRKYGWGVNLEQSLFPGIGAFARLGWNDGRSETFAWTEIDRHTSLGLSLRGAFWGRDADTLAIAALRNGLSEDHRDFLAAGGYGFILGDGALNYGEERIVEAYYALAVTQRSAVTLDAQRVVNPAYNRDRGPVDIYSLRLHYEF